MFGPEYKWFLAPVRPAPGGAVRLARRSLLTLAVAAFCLACAFTAPATGVARLAVVAAPATASLEEAGQVEWPRMLVRLWFLLPQFIPAN